MYKSVHESAPVEGVAEVQSLVNLLEGEQDSISIYMTESRMRVQIWGSAIDQKCELEIHSASDGVNYHRQFLKEEVAILTSTKLEAYLTEPLKFGFDNESF